jgi:methylenetetrahydrofolate dehydrogenase (NADP+)/methenyltetrahydrofolate cyclohydrolase
MCSTSLVGSTDLAVGNQVSGSGILQSVRDRFVPYQETITAAAKQATIIRFEASTADPVEWRSRMEASRVSADQKVKNLSWLGVRTNQVVLPADVSAGQFAGLLNRLNDEPAMTAVIVQFPPPARLRQLVQRIAPAKDIDALLGRRSPYPACATADGIARLVEPFATDQPVIAVVGANGFVGSGVVRLLEARGHQAMKLDQGDDLRRVHDRRERSEHWASGAGVPARAGSGSELGPVRVVFLTGRSMA